MTLLYKGHEIKFDERSEMWSCDDLNIREEPKLRSVKSRIDDLSSDERRLDVKVLRLVECSRWSNNGPKVKEVTASMLCAPLSYQSESCSAWIVDGKKREKVSLAELYPMDARQALEEWIRLAKQAEDALEKADKFKDDIGTYNAKTLTAASGQKARKK